MVNGIHNHYPAISSLLAEDLSVDYATRPPPVITEETTKSLEDIIKQRIKDEVRHSEGCLVKVTGCIGTPSNKQLRPSEFENFFNFIQPK